MSGITIQSRPYAGIRDLFKGRSVTTSRGSSKSARESKMAGVIKGGWGRGGVTGGMCSRGVGGSAS